MRVSSLVLIGVVGGIVASGVMLAVLVHSGRVALGSSNLTVSGEGGKLHPEPGASGAATSLERKLQIQEQRLDALDGAVRGLETGLRVSNAVPTGLRLADASSAPSALSIGALTDAGFSQADAEAVMSLVESAELEQMEQRYAARHGRPAHDPVALTESPSSPLSIRSVIVERFGEQGFDRFLYATGQPNRIQVSSIMRDSRAEQAGFEPGDVIVEVSGEAVYSNRDLYRTSVAGEPGDLVPVTVARGATRLELYVGRGPLGVRTDRLSVRPG